MRQMRGTGSSLRKKGGGRELFLFERERLQTQADKRANGGTEMQKKG